MPACCPGMLAPGGCPWHPASEFSGKILPWGRREEKGKSVQWGIWKLYPIKLLELREVQKGPEFAGKRLKVADDGEGFGEVGMQPSMGGTFRFIVSFGFAAPANGHTGCVGCKKGLRCYRNSALPLPPPTRNERFLENVTTF